MAFRPSLLITAVCTGAKWAWRHRQTSNHGNCYLSLWTTLTVPEQVSWPNDRRRHRRKTWPQRNTVISYTYSYNLFVRFISLGLSVVYSWSLRPVAYLECAKGGARRPGPQWGSGAMPQWGIWGDKVICPQKLKLSWILKFWCSGMEEDKLVNRKTAIIKN